MLNMGENICQHFFAGPHGGQGRRLCPVEEIDCQDVVPRPRMASREGAQENQLVDMVELERHVGGEILVIEADQIFRLDLEAASSQTSHATISEAETPTSPHPPGRDQPWSEPSLTRRIFPSRTTAPRTSTLGVAYPSWLRKSSRTVSLGIPLWV